MRDAAGEELSPDDLSDDDVALEPLTIGSKIKVLLVDVDRIKWAQELREDQERLSSLLAEAERIAPERDAKLQELKSFILGKCSSPFNEGNRKLLVFTAFADTADYLYRELAPWAKAELGIDSGLVTGTGHNRSNLPRLRADFTGVLTAFSPRSKERPAQLASDGNIDLLIATDCISEGQNLQDCDTVVNYDIHWNPVRIIQRFGRIDRLGSRNAAIQLVNFWPNMELEEYIGLEQRVTGRMVLLDVSATGEEDLIREQARDAMNDLEYRRKQLLRFQSAVLDLEDLSNGISITDLTLKTFGVIWLHFRSKILERLRVSFLAASLRYLAMETNCPREPSSACRPRGRLRWTRLSRVIRSPRTTWYTLATMDALSFHIRRPA